MDRKFLYNRGGPTNAHEQAVNTTFNDNPYSIELDRFEALEINPDDPHMLSVLTMKKSLLEDAKLVRKILRRDIFYGERSKSPTRSSKSSKNKPKDGDDEDAENEDGVIVVDEEQEDDPENKKEKGDDDSSSEEEEVENEEDLDLDNDYMENHFDNGEGYISDE